MSKIAIKSSSSGTATFTIESPATNTDRTLVLPDVAGTVALTSQIPAAATIASTGEAQAGTNNTNFITPLRLREGFNATGSAPVFACRAFVNFNGEDAVPIRGSGNVSSVTRNGTGDYTVNFTTAMPDANFSAVAVRGNFDGTTSGGASTNNFNTSSVRVLTYGDGGGVSDRTAVCVAILR